jgi:predicted nucleotidyltransferase
MAKEQLEKLIKIFKQYPALKLVYLFGSRVLKNTGPLSDYDFAFYIDGGIKEATNTAMLIGGSLSRALKTDYIDTVILNHTDAPELKYSIIKNGRLIYEVQPYKLYAEPRILNEFFDFRYMLKKHQLTGA